ncbi:DUF4132 domain-containing protein [Paenibacillus bovis]|uniref:DUF4132 domain-containing protein n=1 Tax=Paenibacillus bovis TaxID=1616788 RepID=A0A172ZHQ7_9BACL|nr:DUF4132 domain-containing protein [Paenibacillus bovis]ANF96680.1 hypothetical protein AR543_12105 [Paenibacillus bovis]
MLINQSTDPLLARFAEACSAEYSLSVDRKQSILDYISGQTDEFPAMMHNSNSYGYRTMELLQKIGQKERGDSFYRAAAVVILTSSQWQQRYYMDPFSLCMEEYIKPTSLSAKGSNAVHRREKGLEALRMLHKYAGSEIIEGVIQRQMKQAALNRKSPAKGENMIGRLDTIVELLELMKLYGELEPEFVNTVTEELPPLLQAVLTGNEEQLRLELKQIVEPIVLGKMPMNDYLSALDLEPAFLESQQTKIRENAFGGMVIPEEKNISREQFYQGMMQVHAAFFYVLNSHGDKTQLLEQPGAEGTSLLEAIRHLYTVLPIEVSYYLTSLERRSTDMQMFEGIVPLEEPYDLITMVQRELNYYMPSWNTIRAELLAQPDRTRRGIEIARQPIVKAIMYKVLAEQNIIAAEDHYLEQLVLDVLTNKIYSYTAGRKLGRYLTGEFELETVLKDQQVSSIWNGTGHNPKGRVLLTAVTMLPIESDLFRRFIIIACQPEWMLGSLSLLYRSPFFDGQRVLEVYENDPQIDTENMLKNMLMLNGHSNYYYISIPDPVYADLVRSHITESLAYYNELPTDGRAAVLDTLFAEREQLSPDQLSEAIRLGLGDSSKRINALSRVQFSRTADHELYMNIYQKEKKADVKEMILNALRSSDHAEQAYTTLLKQEKSDTFRTLIQVFMDTLGQSPEQAHAALAAASDTKKRSRLDWLPIERLPQLQHQDGHPLNDEIKRYMLLQSLDYTTAPNERLQEIKQYATAASLADFALELVQIWIQHGAAAKEKWVLYLASLYGDRRLMDLLGHQIKEWTESSRGAIAAETVKVLAYLNDVSALMLIDRLSRTIKNRQVKTAATEALQLAAENMNLTAEQLADRLITTLGFDRKGQQQLSYGERSFTVKVNSDLQLTVINEENGKTVKSMPAPSQKDDPELAKQSKARFTQIKKDLKTMVTLQAQRLEESLSKRRLWTQNEWSDLFVDNVIMRQFAVGLIWGIYKDGQLTETFRYMDDGTFNTVEEEEYEPQPDAAIGLVHPLEMTTQQIADWKSQLEDYEISQPFTQLERQIYVVEEEQRQLKEWTGLPQDEFSPTAFPKALEKYGWYKGMAEDGGVYYDLYKDYGDLVAQLHFNGTSISYYEGMEDIMLETLSFYKQNSSSRYHYYDPTQARPLGNIPSRVFSETVYDILRAAGQVD